MKKSMILIGSLLAVALMTSYAFSWGHGRGGFDQNCPRLDQPAFNDLNKAQKDELTALRQQFIDDTYESRVTMMQKHNEARMLMQTSDPDKTKLSKLSEEITDLQKKIRERQIDFQLAAKKIAPELNFGRGFSKGCGQRGPRNGQGYGNCPGQGRMMNQ